MTLLLEQKERRLNDREKALEERETVVKGMEESIKVERDHLKTQTESAVVDKAVLEVLKAQRDHDMATVAVKEIEQQLNAETKRKNELDKELKDADAPPEVITAILAMMQAPREQYEAKVAEARQALHTQEDRVRELQKKQTATKTAEELAKKDYESKDANLEDRLRTFNFTDQEFLRVATARAMKGAQIRYEELHGKDLETLKVLETLNKLIEEKELQIARA